MKLCSACLLGINCRYDGESRPNEKIIKLAAKEILIPVCPEQLGGLATPRTAAEKKGDQVTTADGKDVTSNFIEGAKQVLKIARLLKIDSAILKQKSPSCGCGKIYDGNFSGILIEGYGVTAQYLRENNINILTEEDI